MSLEIFHERNRYIVLQTGSQSRDRVIYLKWNSEACLLRKFRNEPRAIPLNSVCNHGRLASWNKYLLTALGNAFSGWEQTLMRLWQSTIS